MSEPQTLFGVGERDRGKRLDRFLNERIPGLSRARIQRAIEERVTLSWGVRARASTPVRPGAKCVAHRRRGTAQSRFRSRARSGLARVTSRPAFPSTP